MYVQHMYLGQCVSYIHCNAYLYMYHTLYPHVTKSHNLYHVIDYPTIAAIPGA
jgi:hypothetical protein